LDLAIHVFRHTNPIIFYLIVAIILLLESSGIPIANNTLLLFTGALASFGHLNILVLAIVALMGSISGACLAYVIGLRGGRRFLFRVSKRLHIDAQKINKAEGWFHRTGARMIFLSRITPYIRPFACFPAGMTRMPFRHFFVAALSGSILWCVTVLSIGWTLGRNWRVAYSFIQTYTLLTIGLLALAIAAFILIKYAMRRRQRSQTEAASDEESDIERQDTRDLLEV